MPASRCRANACWRWRATTTAGNATTAPSTSPSCACVAPSRTTRNSRAGYRRYGASATGSRLDCPRPCMNRLFRSLLPRSLRTRLILLVLGAVLLAQAATLATVSYYRQKFLEDVAIGYIATTIRTLRAAVSEIPADDRAEFVRNASQNQWRLWSRTLPAEARLQRFSRTPPSPGTQQGGSGTPHRDIDRIRHRSHHDAPTDDIRDDLRSLIRKLNDRLNDGTRVALSH